jgi:murein L,D-transpeptidase YcbB/YkuD
MALAAASAQPVPGRQLPPPVAAPPVAAPVAPLAAPVLPPPVWDSRDALQLLNFIRDIGTEGLEPLDYDPHGFEKVLVNGPMPAISDAASDRFKRVASDLALGHVRGDDREGWSIKDPDLDDGRLDQLLRQAVAQHRVVEALQSLLPTHPQYGALKTALMITPKTDKAKYQRIRLNMDRWRWLPRDLGDRYIIVNVPAYTAALVEDGVTTSRHHAVAGKISTPTPQLSAIATGVILNPWWEVPKSIEKEVRGKKGYVPVKGESGKIIRYRQPPGPSNALGRVKFVMPNPHAIYLHDTKARSKFNSSVRAFSHGCIRTEDIMGLATKLLNEGGDEWTPDKIKATLASGKSVQASFPKPLPVYIVYMSSAAHVDGRIIDYPDVYDRDDKVIAALLDGRKTAQPKTADQKVAAK